MGRVKAAREREEVEAKLRKLEKEVDELRKRPATVTAVAPSVKPATTKQEQVEASTAAIAAVRSELAKVVADAASAERRAEMLDASRRRYKAQWVRALSELAKAKKGWQMEIQERVAKEQRLVDALRVRVLAGEEMERVRGGLREVEGMRREVQDGKREKGRRPGKSPGGSDGEEEGSEGEDAGVRLLRKKMVRVRENMDPKVYAEVERLAGERDSLVQSGVYGREDRLIRELDAR
ncbi:hypothetical protein HDU67_005701, partial [Dinochytrium kinnereticum]